MAILSQEGCWLKLPAVDLWLFIMVFPTPDKQTPRMLEGFWVVTNGRSSAADTQWVEANVTAKSSTSYGLEQKWPHAEVKGPAFGSAPEGLSSLAAQAACLPACKDCIKQARRWALLPARQPYGLH